jgi:hypothetical protein
VSISVALRKRVKAPSSLRAGLLLLVCVDMPIASQSILRTAP